jgi:hypothetical protein
VTLQTRIYHVSQLKLVEKKLKATLEGLDVQVVIRGTHGRGWVEASVSGQDEKVALRFLRDNVGLCPSSVGEIHKFSVVGGFVAGRTGSRNELRLDVGFVFPSVIDAVIPLRRLQAQLVDGRKMALSTLVDLFGLCPGLPVQVRMLRVDPVAKYLEAELSEKQQSQFTGWVRSMLDRLLVFGCSSDEVRDAVITSELDRDIVDVEPLGMFESAVVCKLGTDAVGLVPKIGRVLRNSALSVFSPRKIVELLGESAFSFTF